MRPALLYELEQGAPNYGLQARSDPQKAFMWPTDTLDTIYISLAYLIIPIDGGVKLVHQEFLRGEMWLLCTKVWGSLG